MFTGLVNFNAYQVTQAACRLLIIAFEISKTINAAIFRNDIQRKPEYQSTFISLKGTSTNPLTGRSSFKFL